VGVVRGLFDPTRDGFGFRNPVGMAPKRTGGGTLLRRLDVFLYGSGLCFGMAAAALANFQRPTSPYPLAALPLTPDLLGMLRGYHARQARPGVIVAAVSDWLRARGGRPEGLLDRLRLPGESTDPHVLNFGPALNGSFFRCLYRAHAVLPYRVEGGGEERRLYVYDPNHPGDRGRYVSFRGGGFGYGGFSSGSGWGITLVPLSAIRDTARPSAGAVV
jgi:hypothetical protein